MSEKKRLRPATRTARILAAVLAPVIVVAGILLPVAPAQASVFNVVCGDIHGVSGLVAQMDLANRSSGETIVSLAAGCTYVVDEPAWDYDDWGNKIYYDSAFWPIEDRHSHAHMVVEGNGATITRAATGARYRFFDIDFRGEVTLKNLTLRGGLAPHGSDSFYYNAEEGQGGGAIKNEGRLTLIGVTLSGNFGGSGENGSSGGSGNGYPGGGGGEGGAIWNSGTLTINGSTITGNRSGSGGSGGNGFVNGGQGGASGNGAGIYNRGSLTVATSVISDNVPGDVGSGGSAIFGAPPAVRGSGAGIYSYSGSVVVNRSLIKGNLSEGTLGAEGGAIALGGGTLSVNSSTFIGNKAWRGGALHLSNASGTVRNSTFIGNDATGTGDQITGDVAAMDRGATLSFANTLMSGNDASQVDCNIQVWDPPVTFSSLGGLVSDENTGCGTNTILADPKLEALGNWGGPTQSRLPKADSALLGAGATAYCGGVDQRGVTRPASGCDVGAVERVALSTVGVISGPNIVPLNTAKTYTTSSSAGGAPLDYSWSVSGVAATFSSTTAAAPSITFTGSGVATVNLTVKVTGTSSSEAVAVPGFTVKVPPASNHAPTLTWTGTPASTANEGDTKTYAYSYSDADSDAVTPIAGYPSCGTGGTLVAQSMSGGTGSIQCSFPNGPATPTVSMRVEDYWSTLTTLTQAVTVAEVAPTITVTGNATADEGSVASFSYTIHEPGSDTFTPATTCAGLGASKVSGSDVYTGSGHDTAGSFQCRFANGPASTTATVTANGGTGSKAVTVANLAPSVAIGGPTPVDENGAAVSTYRYLLNATDPGDQAGLQYVAGSASCGGTGVGTVVSADLSAVVCRFASGPGTAQVTAQVKDPNGATSSGGGKTVTVTNVAPTVVVSQPTGPVAEGATVNYALTATDPGIDTLTVTPPSGCTANNINTATPGKLTATIACVYTDGPATESRTVTVGDGAVSGSATIANQQIVDSDPSIEANFTTPWVYQHTSATLNLGAITDAGSDTVTAITVYWGDGTHTDLAWPVAGGQASHVYAVAGWFYPTIDLVDEDATHADRGPDLLMPAYDVTATVNLNVPASAVEGVPTTITFTVNEDFTVDWTGCYTAYDANNVPFQVPATNLVTTERGGSFVCTWPQSGRDHDVYLGIVGSAWTSKRIHIDNALPVVTWDDPVPLTVTENDSTWVRFPFHASDSGTLGVAVLAYPLSGGFAHQWGCGDGNPSFGNYYDGPPVFDNNSGTGYLDCQFANGPQSAVVWLSVTDFAGSVSISRTVNVLNGAPSVTLHGPADAVAEGSAVDFTYEASDPGSDAVTVVTRSCGPGGTVTNTWAVGFTCVYDDGPNSAIASITVTDGEVTASDIAVAEVVDVAPTGELWGGAFYDPRPDHEYSLTLANFNDPGDDDVTTVIVDWGDGSTSNITDGSTSFAHQYAGIGFHTISLSVVNEEGEFAIGTKQVQDADQSPPVWTPHGDQTIERNYVNGAIFWPTLEATDDRGIVSIGCWQGPYYYLGDQTMDCYAIDAAGNEAWDYWTLHIVDTVLPVLTPLQKHFEATSPDGAIVNFGVRIDDIGLTYPEQQAEALQCTPASGTLFPVGSTPVHCEATDDGGNTGTVDFTITVGDTTPPAITIPSNLDVSATDGDGAIVGYDAATAYDRYDGTITPVCTPASGSTFPLGVTTVTCSAVDGSGNAGHESFTVTVADRTPPVVTTSPNVVIAPTDPGGAVVDYDAATATDAVDGDIDPADVTCDPASGSTFALGVTIVVCSTEDAAGNPGSASFTVTVQDPDAPTLTPPVEAVGLGLAIITAEATGADGAEVPWTAPIATDVIDGVLDVDCDHDPGDTYPLGRTLVTCTADDSAHNRGTLVFAVDVVDTTSPTIAPATDVTVEATSPDGAVAAFELPAASDAVDSAVTAVCTPASGSTFLVGTTTVSCTASDARHNVSSRTFAVTVADTTAPDLQLEDLTVGAGGPTGANVSYAPVGIDIVNGEVPAVCTPASGALFAPESWTTVSCSVVDLHGNRATGSFLVTVHGAVTTEAMEAEDTEVEVSLDGFEIGDYVVIDEGGSHEEVRLISGLGSIIFAAPVAHAHPAGTRVAVIAAPSNDTLAPVITVTQPGNVGQGTALTAQVTCTDVGVGVEACRVPALPTLSLGEHVVTVWAWDWNGNVSTAELRYTVVGAGTAGLAYTGGSMDAGGSIAILLLLTGLCLIAYRRWSQREAW